MSRTIRVINRRSRPWLVGALQWAFVTGTGLALGLIVSVAVAGAVFYVQEARHVPAVPAFETLDPGRTTVITARDGQLLSEYGARRLDLSFDDIPAGVILALLAAEDERFFEHGGLDVRGVLRAALANLQARRFVEGASTLTQQLAKSVLGRPEKFGHDAGISFRQKVREAIYARRLEDIYTKEQILLLYLNRVDFGHGASGVRVAAQRYFRKDLSELNLAEMALLAGLPQAPSWLNPVRHGARATRRMRHVLDQMVRNGFIRPSERDAALRTQVRVFPRTDVLRDGAPYVVRAVERELSERLESEAGAGDWRSRGLRVETTADLAWQRIAEDELARGLRRLGERQGYRGPLRRLGDGLARGGVGERVRRGLFLARTRAELAGKRPTAGSLWPAWVEDVDTEGADLRLTDHLAGRVSRDAMRWAAPYTEGKRPSFDRKLKDPREALRRGDIVLVEVEGGRGEHLELALTQEPKVEGAVVVLDPASAELRVVEGGYDFDRSEVNRVWSVRPTGSVVKPAIYSLAYDAGLKPSTVLSAAPFREGDYAPTRGKGKGDLLVWDALATSENNVSQRVWSFVRKRLPKARIQAWFRALGFDLPIHGYPAEVLGVDQRPIGVARMMATFANGGLTVTPRLLRKVVARSGRVLVRPSTFYDPMNGPIDILDALDRQATAPPARSIPQTTAYIIASNLRDVFLRGTARREGRGLKPKACGKTGTLAHDVWFAGFTSRLAAVVWVGADRNERPLGSGGRRSHVYGGNTALPIWRELVNGVSGDDTGGDPLGPPPEGVVIVSVDPKSGWLAKEGGRKVALVKGTEPTAAEPSAPGDGDEDILQSDF